MSHIASGDHPPTLTFFSLMVSLILAVSAGMTATVVYAQTEEKVVAVVNDRKITQNEVDKSVAAQLIPLLQQIYALRKTALENLVSRTILETEARKRGLSVGDLKREFTAAKVEVRQSDVDQEYAENRSAFGAMSEDEAKVKTQTRFRE